MPFREPRGVLFFDECAGKPSKSSSTHLTITKKFSAAATGFAASKRWSEASFQEEMKRLGAK